MGTAAAESMMHTTILVACLAALHVPAAGFVLQTPATLPQLKASVPQQLKAPRPAGFALQRRTSSPAMMSGLSSEQPSEGAFVAKVFGTLGIQIAATAATATAIVTTPQLHAVASGEHPLVWPAATVSLALAFLSRRVNEDASMLGKVSYLSAFTLSESWLLGVVCSSYVDAGLGHLLLQAAGITTFDVAVLTAYALLAQEDFSFLGGALSGALLALIGGGLVQLGCMAIPSLAPLVPMQDLALSVAGAMVFCLYIVYDVARLKGDYFEQDDYIGATMNLYLDIVNLFLDVLRILASTSSSKRD